MFELSVSPRVIFGSGSLSNLPELVTAVGRRVLLVCGSREATTARIQTLLKDSELSIDVFRVVREPTVADIAQGVTQAREFKPDVVLGVGGGSVLDAAKAIAAVSTNPGHLLDYLEVVGRGQALSAPGLPCIAVPTTSGTGAEVTRNAVIDVPEQSTKVSVRGAYVVPRVALVDPELTLTVPPDLTAYTGFDALTQVIEPFLSRRHQPMTDGVAKEGIQYAARALRRVYVNGADQQAREQMAWVSLMGGWCLTHAGLGAVHGFAGPLGGLLHAPHGALCASLLAPTLAGNLDALRRDTSVDRTDDLERYRTLAQLLTSRPEATADDAIGYLTELSSNLAIPKLSHFGLTESKFGEVIERAKRASSMQYNAIQLTATQLEGILRVAL
jgi:alcohol dehydrogenase class IV